MSERTDSKWIADLQVSEDGPVIFNGDCRPVIQINHAGIGKRQARKLTDLIRNVLNASDGMTNDEAALYLEYGPRIVELLKEIIQLGHSNSDKYCNCPDCKNAVKIKKVLALIGNKS